MIAVQSYSLLKRVLSFISRCFGDRFGEGKLALFSTTFHIWLNAALTTLDQTIHPRGN